MAPSDPSDQGSARGEPVSRTSLAPGCVLEHDTGRHVFARTPARPAFGRAIAALFVLPGLASFPRALASELSVPHRAVAARAALVLLGVGAAAALAVGERVSVDLNGERAVLRRTGLRGAWAAAPIHALRVEVSGCTKVAEVRASVDGAPLPLDLGACRRADAERLAVALLAFASARANPASSRTTEESPPERDRLDPCP